jgi:glycerol-3-phosphate O-acyltransferase/dihydroxyacetone phosphate acyltransferase
VSDHQVPQLQFWAWRYLLGSLLMMILPWALAVVPGLLLNAPVGLLAHVLAVRHQRAALRASSVKLAARDVVLSRKILVSIVGVPSLWLAYGLLLLRYSGWQRTSVLLVVLAFPLASYIGVRATEAGMVAFNDLRPLLLRLVRSRRTRQQMLALPAQRRNLQLQLQKLVKKYGPALGDMYYASRFDPLSAAAAAADPTRNRFDPEQAAEAHGGLTRHTMRQRSASAVDLQKKGS